MQTILGSGGAIGVELAKALTEYTSDIRLVSRKPEKVNDTDTLFPADLLDLKKVDEAVAGSDVVYVTVGFSYSLKVWQASWPPFMESVIAACKKHKAKLVFFDNIYMYEPSALGGMTESAPVQPPSKKGMVRAEVAEMVLQEIRQGKLEALIARSADFYGPSIKNTSMLTEMVFAPLSKGKKANWMVSLDHKHSFTYTPDAGKATALLGNTEDAYGQVWHLPTAKYPFTGKEWITEIAEEMGKPPRIQIASKFMVKLMGLFIPVMREMPEMLYQYNREYVFKSDKFEKRFKFTPTPYKTGIKEIIKVDYSK